MVVATASSLRGLRTAAAALLFASGLAAGAWAAVDPHAVATADLDPGVVQRGSQVYAANCAGCHDSGLNRAPQPFMLLQMAPESIHRALTDGVMRPIGANLTEGDKQSVAQFLAQRPMSGRPIAPLMCAKDASPFDFGEPPVFSGWGLTPQNSHAMPTATAGLSRANVGSLTLKWALAFPNAIRARSQPALAGGALFVGSHDGSVFALDRRTGCARWVFQARAEVRTGLVVSPWAAGDRAARPQLYFGDVIGNVYAVDALSGALAWTHKADPHSNTTLTATPVLHNGQLFVPVSSLEEASSAGPSYPCCTFRGSLIAYEAHTGKIAWQTFMTEPPSERGHTATGTPRFGPSGVALWDSPAIDEKRGRLYIATGDNYSGPTTSTSDAVLAIDYRTGRIAWAYQALERDAWNGACVTPQRSNCPDEDGPDFDFGAAPVLARASNGHEYVVAGQKSGIVYAIDPENGHLVWKNQLGRGSTQGGVQFGIAVDGNRVFAPINDIADGRTYTQPARPGLYALDLATGKLLWEAPAPNTCAGRRFCEPGYSSAVTATPELVLSGGNDGRLRAFDAESGAALWEFDALQEFQTLNSAPAHGGSFGGGAAPVPYHGMLFVNSGYGFAGKMPGNVLLAFEVK